MKLKGVLEELHLREDEARNGEREKDEPYFSSTAITTKLTHSKTMEHFSDPILSRCVDDLTDVLTEIPQLQHHLYFSN